MHNHDLREDGWKAAVAALMKLMQQDEERELKEKWLELALQRLGMWRWSEIRVNPPWSVFVRVFFRGVEESTAVNGLL